MELQQYKKSALVLSRPHEKNVTKCKSRADMKLMSPIYTEPCALLLLKATQAARQLLREHACDGLSKMAKLYSKEGDSWFMVIHGLSMGVNVAVSL